MNTLTLGSLRWLVLPILCLFAHHVPGEVVTLIGTPTAPTSQLEVKAGQVARVISWPFIFSSGSALQIIKGDYTNRVSKSDNDFNLPSPIVVAGPATFTLSGE